MKNDFIKNRNNVVKQDKPKTANNLAIIIIVIISLCAVISAVFSVLLYFKNNDKVKTASAESVSVYYTSSRYISMTGYAQNAPPNSVGYDMTFWDFLNLYRASTSNLSTCVFDFAGVSSSSIDFYANFNAITPKFNYSNCVYFLSDRGIQRVYPYVGNILFFPLRTTSIDCLIDTIHDNNTFSSMTVNWFASTQAPSWGNSAFYSYIGVSVVDGFNFNVVSLRTFTRYFALPDNYMADYNFYRLCVNVFRYADDAGNYLDIYIPLLVFFSSTTNTEYSFYALTDNTVYFTNPNNTYDDGYKAGYFNGYAAGDIDGYSVGHTDGFDTGYKQGNVAGYNRGRNDGIASANNYSFLGLLGAVVDAPIKAFTGLLNFNLLGFNMLSFFLGLITLCLILWIVRKLLGG